MMLQGKTALLTGASRGIGLGIAAAIVQAGGRVCITGRRQEGLDAALQELDAGDDAFAVQGSSDNAEHRSDAVSQVLERFGSLDLLVNNAGINPQYGPMMEAELPAVTKVMEVNVVAPLAWVQLAWHHWMAEHGGVVLNIASVGGVNPGASIGAYNVSKAALIHLTRQLAAELGPQVRVNAVAPAVVKTNFARALYEGREEEVSSTYPLKRLGRPEDVAAMARFLLSDEASWITGETVVLDGGISQVSWQEA